MKKSNPFSSYLWSDPKIVSEILFSIKRKAENFIKHNSRPIQIMEVCGTHTMAIAKSGIREELDGYVNLLSGPGCPVCVTAQGEIDALIKISNRNNLIITTFGDMLKVKGSNGVSLSQLKSRGVDVRIVYSSLDAVEIAKQNNDKYIVFVGVGFETTSPTIAASIKYAYDKNIKNFFVTPFFKLVPPALKYLLDFKIGLIDGFILPGHVSVIIGKKSYSFLNDYDITSVISGFEPLDILRSIDIIIEKRLKNENIVFCEYDRAVTDEGNPYANELIKEVFETVDAHWRGVGVISMSGFSFSKKYDSFDALKRFGVDIIHKPEPKGCLCGMILLGLKKPTDCSLFGKKCRPEDAVGPCMVSSEGACAAWYKYGIKK